MLDWYSFCKRPENTRPLRHNLKTVNYSNCMSNLYTAILKQDGNWWIGWIEEVPGVNCQEATREELIDSLKITLKEVLDLNKQDAIAAAGVGYQEEQIAV